MPNPRILLIAAALLALGVDHVAAQVRLQLHEGTNIAAALSPDGKTLAIDELGSIWTLPASGGVARRITDEFMDARQPTWSSDGRRIAFQAYRSNTWNIWTVNRDGSDLRQVTWGPFDDREPHWSPDGTRIAFSSDRSGNYDIWFVTLGTGEVTRVTHDPANDYAPAWSPNGGEVAFVSDRAGAPGIYATTVDGHERLLARAGGMTRTTGIGTPAVGSALAGLSWSPDGQTVAYSVVQADTSLLMVNGKNIADHAEDVFPFRPQWISPSEILYTSDGKIKRRSASGGPAATVAFTADVEFDRPAFKPRRREFGTARAQPVRGIVHPAISPDGGQIAFVALGDLWLMPVTGTPRRITNDRFVEMDPAWSPDGKRLVYSSDRAGSMDLWLRDVATGSERRLTTLPGAETRASWSPDGRRVAFLHDTDELDIVDVDAPDGTAPVSRRVEHEPGGPSWSPDGKWIVLSSLKPSSTRFREGTNQVLRIGVNGEPDQWFDPAPHKSIGMRGDTGPVWSPNGTQMAAIVDGRLTVFAVGHDGEPIGPLRELSTELAGSPTWTGDSRHILYQTDDRLKLVDVIDGDVREIDPGLTWTAKTATNLTVIHAGRLWDGKSASARENVDIVLDGTRIKAVEPHRAALHTGSVVDASNETVVPGLIEIHSHLMPAYGEALGRAFLSWGVTTVRDPGGDPFVSAEEREAIESGVRIGPRLFGAGDPIDGTRIYYPGGTTIDGGAQLTEQLERASRLHYDLMKTYVRLPDLLQKRVVEEAHRRGLPVTSHELYPAVAFGADGVEHLRGTSRRGYSPKQSQLDRTYGDVISLLAASGMTITPTIGIQGGFQLQTIEDASWMNDPRMALYPPRALAQWRSFTAQPHSQQELDQRRALVKATESTVYNIVQAGGRVTAGTDAPINPYGLAFLMELEQYVHGGLTPLQALQSATSVNAQALGMGADLGTVEPGRFADLVMVDGNPLTNIRDLRRVKRVVKDGVVYDETTLVNPVRP